MWKQGWKKLHQEWLNGAIIKTLPIFIAINLVALVIWQLDISHLAMPLVLGVIAGGLVDLDNSFTGRLQNLLFSLGAFAVSSFFAQFSLGYGIWFIPLATMLTFIVVMLGALGQRYSTIAFGALVVAVYTSLTFEPSINWYHNTLMILAGSLIYGSMAMLVHLIFPHRIVQDNLANAYQTLSRYLLAKSAYFDPDDDSLSAKQLNLTKANADVMQAFEQTRVSLFYRLRRNHRQTRTHRLLRYYFSAQDILERASAGHYRYQQLFDDLRNSDLMFRFQRVLELQANACQQMANALRHNETYRHNTRVEKALNGLTNSLHYHQKNGLKNCYRWFSIAENLRHIEQQLKGIAEENLNQDLRHFSARSTRLLAENVSGWRNMFNAVKENVTLSSQLFRHAIRLSIVVALCSAIVQFAGLDNKGYWILLTAIFVCQPNYAATKSRLIQRVIGTFLGVMVGMSLPYFSPSLEAQLGLVVLTGTLYSFFRFRHYGFSTFYITLLVLVSLDIIGHGSQNLMLPRLIDTITGTAIAWFAVSFIYPDWHYLNLTQNFKNTLNACANYLRHITAQLQFGYNEQLPYRNARRTVHNSLSSFSNAVSTVHNEPAKYHTEIANAPLLLGQTYTLLSYISALGAYRIESDNLNHQVNFAALFFNTTNEIIDLIEHLAQHFALDETQMSKLSEKINRLQQNAHDELSQTLLQQLHLIIQLLPQLVIQKKAD